MSCKECGCTKAAEQTLVEKTSNLALAESTEQERNCRANSCVKSCCSSASNSSSPWRPSRGCSCCRSCCACCRCCSGSSRDVCQDRTNGANGGGCSCCASKKTEVVKEATCGCSKQ